MSKKWSNKNDIQLMFGAKSCNQITYEKNTEIKDYTYFENKLKYVVGFEYSGPKSSEIEIHTTAHCQETKLKHKRMGTLQFYIPGFQNDPSFPKQKEFLKSTQGNLK